MSKNTVTQFMTSFVMIATSAPSLSDLTGLDFTAYATARQILLETQKDSQDQESITLNKMANKLIRILDEGKPNNQISSNSQKHMLLKRSQQVPHEKSPLRVQIHLEEQQIDSSSKSHKIKNTKEATRSHKRTLTPKRQTYYPSPAPFKDQNHNYGNQQQRVSQPAKKIVELMRKQYRKDNNYVQSFDEPEKQQNLQKYKKIKHKKSNSSLAYVCRILNEEPKLRKVSPRVEKPNKKIIQLFSQKSEILQNSQREDQDSEQIRQYMMKNERQGRQKEKEFMYGLKDEFSSICCNELNEEQKKVSEELKLLEIKLGQIVGQQTPYRNHDQPRVSPCHFNTSNTQDGSIATKTVRVNLTPKRTKNNNRDKSPKISNAQSQLLSKRLEKAMRV